MTMSIPAREKVRIHRKRSEIKSKGASSSVVRIRRPRPLWRRVLHRVRRRLWERKQPGVDNDSSDIESTGAPSSHGIMTSARPPWMQVLHRVQPQLREGKHHVYDPSVLSLGPYHHGQPQCRPLEKLKDEVVKVMLKEETRILFRRKIAQRIDNIRHFYGGLSPDEVHDDVLTEMMLRDACTVLYLLDLNTTKEGEERKRDDKKVMLVLQHLGLLQACLMTADVVKLENQIPWWLMNSLISLAYNEDQKGKELIRRFLSFLTFGNYADLKQLPWDIDKEDRDEYYPLHLLEAIHNTIQMVDNSDITEHTEVSTEISFLHPGRHSFRSVTELKAKGIYFKPSSHFLTDIKFKSYYMFGVLRLPVFAISKDSRVVFSNIMALEMSPGTPCMDSIMTSYLMFMKSMIESSKDVKLLREKGIIVSVEDNEEIVRMFKEIDSYGVDLLPGYDEMRIKINRHCDSKAKTWIADLINTYFHSPWAVLALLATALLLCLTFLQTYYTLNPRI